MPTASPRCRSTRRCSSGTSIRPRSPAATSITTSAIATTSAMRDILEALVTHDHAPGADDARRGDALHQAVLDQQRRLQQPHRAQVRAAPERRRRWSRPPTPRRGPAPASALPGRVGGGAGPAPGADASSTPTIDPMVTCKTPGGRRRHPARQRQQPLRRRDDGRPRRASRSGIRSTRAWSSGTASWSKRSTASAAATTTSCRASSRHLRSGDPDAPRRRSPRPCAALIQWYRTGEDARSRGLRHRLGAGHRHAGGHDERLHRGLHGRPRHQGRVGRPGLLRQRREDREDPAAGRERAVVRGPPADRAALPQADGAGRHRHGHRRRRRSRRLRSDHADRRQPPQRPADPRGARQQVGDAVERDRGLREQHHRRVPPRVHLGRRRVRSRQAVGRHSPAS